MAGTFECFNCLGRSVIWDGDFTYEDCGYEGNGIVHFLHCMECGAEIEYRVPFDEGHEPESMCDLLRDARNIIRGCADYHVTPSQAMADGIERRMRAMGFELE